MASAGQLVELAGRQVPDAAPSLLAVGGVDYDHASEVVPARPDGPGNAQDRSPPPNMPRRVKPLPGTEAEAKAVAELFRRLRSGDAQIPSGPLAAKVRLASSLAGKRYIHLATHGYSADPQKAPATPTGGASRTMPSFVGLDRRQLVDLYPGLLSGLYWAGANSAANDPRPGGAGLGSALMTAEEVAGLDLAQCDLAVLSACETGLGKVAGGEGVLGLQRAFHQAGARTVIGTLWCVEDASTQALMERFYAKLWEKKLTKLEALRQAQLALLRDELRPDRPDARRGLGHKSEILPEAGASAPLRPSARVRLWAAFVMSGDCR